MKTLGNYRNLRTVKTSEGTFVNAVDLIRQARVEAMDQAQRTINEGGGEVGALRTVDEWRRLTAWLSAVVEYSNDAIAQAEAGPPAKKKAPCDCPTCKQAAGLVVWDSKLQKFVPYKAKPSNPGDGSTIAFGSLGTPIEEVEPPGSYFTKKPQAGDVAQGGTLSPGGMGVRFVVGSDGRTYLDAEGLVEASTLWASRMIDQVHGEKPFSHRQAMRAGVESVVLYLRNAVREVKERFGG